MFVDDGFAVKRVNLLPKYTETDMLQCASRLFSVKCYLSVCIEYSSVCAIVYANGSDRRGFKKNAVRRGIVFIAVSLKYARLVLPMRDRIDNGCALRSNKSDASPCA